MVPQFPRQTFKDLQTWWVQKFSGTLNNSKLKIAQSALNINKFTCVKQKEEMMNINLVGIYLVAHGVLCAMRVCLQIAKFYVSL